MPYKFTPYINSKPNRHGLHNIMIKAYCNGQRRSVKTDYYIDEKHWDRQPSVNSKGVLQYVKKSYYDYSNANKQIALRISKAREFINEIEERQRRQPGMDEVMPVLEGRSSDEGLDNFIAWAMKQMNIHYRDDQVGTKHVYKHCLKNLEAFIGREFSIYELSKEKVTLFQRYLASRLAPSTVRQYMNMLSTIVKRAREDDHIDYNLNPFGNIEKVKIQRSEIDKNKDTDFYDVFHALIINKSQQIARDFFLACFYLSGSRARDVLLLKNTDIDLRTMRVNFQAVKTSKKVNVQIYHRLLPILKKYIREDALYLFPYLDDVAQINDDERLHSYAKKTINKINYHLQCIGRQADMKRLVTTHSARHIFSRIVERLQGRDAVRKVLDHYDPAVTTRYLSHDQRELDDIRETAYDYVEPLLEKIEHAI